MKKILHSPFRNLFLAGLFVYVLSAWFSVGYNNLDEHFLVLEFANYKAGRSPAADLPWEFAAKVRPALQPAIAYLLIKATDAVHMYNPFTVAFLLRLLMAFAAWFIICQLSLLLSERIHSPPVRKLLVMMSMFLWFIPYLNVRYSPESFSAVLFLYGCWFLLHSKKNGKTFNRSILFAGFFFGFAACARIQIMFSIIGFIACLIWLKKLNPIAFRWKNMLGLTFSGLLAISICVLIDHWFYDEWVFIPLRYYNINMVAGKAAEFGVSPPWFYLTGFVMQAIPPLSVILLGLFIAGLWKNMKDPLVWALLAFVLGHSLIGHKEMRFIYPVSFLFIFIVALGLDHLLSKNWFKKFHKPVLIIALLVNIPVLLLRLFIPAQEAIPNYKWLYLESSQHPIKVIAVLGKASKMNFYIHPNTQMIWLNEDADLKNWLQVNHPDTAFYINKNLKAALNIPDYQKEVVYCFLPGWILKNDWNHWQENSNIWNVIRFTRLTQH